MSLSGAQIAEQQKIHTAKRHLEENEGKTIKADKIQAWALLDTCEKLSAIHFVLVQSNLPKFGPLIHAGWKLGFTADQLMPSGSEFTR